jgi:hypothetical protein
MDLLINPDKTNRLAKSSMKKAEREKKLKYDEDDDEFDYEDTNYDAKKDKKQSKKRNAVAMSSDYYLDSDDDSNGNSSKRQKKGSIKFVRKYGGSQLEDMNKTVLGTGGGMRNRFQIADKQIEARDARKKAEMKLAKKPKQKKGGFHSKKRHKRR